MKKFLIAVLILCLTVSVKANPFLTAEPVETPDYYVVSINGKTNSVSPAIPDEVLIYDLEPLTIGKHEVEIITGGFDEGEGPAVIFKITKTIEGEWTVYEILPFYDNTRFIDPLKVSILTELQEPPKPPEPPNSRGRGRGGGGGGGGCSG